MKLEMFKKFENRILDIEKIIEQSNKINDSDLGLSNKIDLKLLTEIMNYAPDFFTIRTRNEIKNKSIFLIDMGSFFTEVDSYLPVQYDLNKIKLGEPNVIENFYREIKESVAISQVINGGSLGNILTKDNVVIEWKCPSCKEKVKTLEGNEHINKHLKKFRKGSFFTHDCNKSLYFYLDQDLNIIFDYI